MASIMRRRDVKSSRGILVHTDCLAENVDYENARMIVLPGGRIGTKNLAASELVTNKCMEFAKDKYVAAVCAAPSILANLNLMKKTTVHPDFQDEMGAIRVLNEYVVIDDNIITGQGLGATIPFALKLVEVLVSPEEAEQIKIAICYRG